MPVLPWLWLNEAALLIATRVPRARAEKCGDAPGASDIAREQLLDAAYRGVIVIEGKSDYIEEHPPVFRTTNWIPIDASVWSTHDHFTDDNPHGRITVRWEHDAIEVDDGGENFDYGFINLRVRAEDVDRIWPPAAIVQTELSDQLYETEWLRLMREAIAHFEITEDNQPMADQLRDWFSSKTVDGQCVSANLAKAMTTFVRLPKSMRGGNRPFQPRNRNLPQKG
jgi:hypothetical protein